MAIEQAMLWCLGYMPIITARLNEHQVAKHLIHGHVLLLSLEK